MIKKIKKSLKYHGVFGFIKYTLRTKLPMSPLGRWKGGIDNEIKFWDGFFTSEEWKEKSHTRLDPNMELQTEIASLLPKNLEGIKILDVGAGPLTYLGTKYKNKILKITPIDPLADEYEKILTKHSITPIIKTIKLAAEEISTQYKENTFDLVFARNCIDHSVSPEQSILEMIKVVKKNCCVYMIHRPNEAINENYRGFHQWNFSISDGDFLIGSKKMK